MFSIRPRLLGTALAMALAAPALAQSPATPVLDPSAIKRDVEQLSSDAFFGRGPGEAGETATLDYLVSQFQAAGLQPGGQDGTWYQNVSLTRFQRENASVLLTIGGRTLPLTLATDISVTSSNSRNPSLRRRSRS